MLLRRRRSDGAAPGRNVSGMSEMLLAPTVFLAVHLVACANLVLIGVLAWTRS